MTKIFNAALILFIALLVSCEYSKPLNQEVLIAVKTPGPKPTSFSEFSRERNRLLEEEAISSLSKKTPILLSDASIPSDALLITNGIIIDGTGKAPIPNGMIIIWQKQILYVGPLKTFTNSPDVDIIDIEGNTMMPGIINAHTHHTYDPVTRHNLLMEGVTSICDLGCSMRCMPHFDEHYTPQNQPAARGFKAGPMLTAPGGYPGTFYGNSWHYDVSNVTEAEAAVYDLLSRGSDVIKIALEPGPLQDPWPVLKPSEVKKIVDTAHLYNVKVCAHVRQAAVLDIALTSGVDVIEHIPVPYRSVDEIKQYLKEDKLHLSAWPQLQNQFRYMADHNVILVPTLEANIAVLNQTCQLTESEQQQSIDFVLEIVRYFHEIGGVIALGNDFGSVGVERGMPIKEMELLLSADLTPMDVIRAGTYSAAQAIGYDDQLGSLEEGKIADLIVVDGDPLADIITIKKVTIIIQDGQLVYRSSEL